MANTLMPKVVPFHLFGDLELTVLYSTVLQWG